MSAPVKHQPDTPLPWTFGHIGFRQAFWIGADHESPQAAMVEERATEFPSERVDAAYIAHAANSYPKLVEALRVLYKSVHDTPQIACEYDPVPNHAAGALLRELGEDV